MLFNLCFFRIILQPRWLIDICNIIFSLTLDMNLWPALVILGLYSVQTDLLWTSGLALYWLFWFLLLVLWLYGQNCSWDNGSSLRRPVKSLPLVVSNTVKRFVSFQTNEIFTRWTTLHSLRTYILSDHFWHSYLIFSLSNLI